MFKMANNFSQDLSGWNISGVNARTNMFSGAIALSPTKMGEIHKTFSSNSNWPYDWSEFVTYEPITDANFQDAVNLCLDKR